MTLLHNINKFYFIDRRGRKQGSDNEVVSVTEEELQKFQSLVLC